MNTSELSKQASDIFSILNDEKEIAARRTRVSIGGFLVLLSFVLVVVYAFVFAAYRNPSKGLPALLILLVSGFSMIS